MRCHAHSNRQTHQICYIPPYFGYYESTRVHQTLHDEDRPTLWTTRGNGGRLGSLLGQILLALCGRQAQPGAPTLYFASPTDGWTVGTGNPAPCHQPVSVHRRPGSQPEYTLLQHIQARAASSKHKQILQTFSEPFVLPSSPLCLMNSSLKNLRRFRP